MIERLIALNDEPPSKEDVKDMCEKLAQDLRRNFPNNWRMHEIVNMSIEKLLDKVQKAENKIN